MSVGMWILVVIGGAAGLFSTLYILVSLFAVIFYKLFRRVKHGISLFD